MLFILTVAAFALLAVEIAARVWKAGGLGPWERACAVFTIGAATWLATLWALALTSNLQSPVLIGRTVVIAGAAIGLALARRDGPENSVEFSRLTLFVAAPIGAWIGFALWKGAIVPPVNHDALSYHLPKAVFFSRLNGFAYLGDLLPHVRSLPANYELLLADILTLERSDALTEWLSPIFYLGFLVSSAALAERWWRNSTASAAVLIFAAGMPVLLLHSSAHKNDVMASSFVVATLVWSGRFLREREVASLWLAIAAISMACGTKPQAAALVLALAPLIAYRLLKGGVALRRIAATFTFGLVCIALLGGAVYWHNLVSDVPEGMTIATPQRVVAVSAYGDWANLWQGPYVLVAAPFSRSAGELAVPWESSPWFWRRYEIFFSEMGLPFAMSALLLPFALIAFRKDEPDSAFERIAVSSAAVAMLIVMLPVRFFPHGMFLISLPRYALFIAPVVFCWTIGPAIRRMGSNFRKGLVATGAIAFIGYASLMAAEDTFAPIDYVMWASAHPGTRVVPFMPRNAASIADRLAGPRDKIAIHARFGAWIHPLFGKELERPVHLIRLGRESAPIPADVDWVVVDALYSMMWQNDKFQDLSQARRFITRGALAEEDRELLANLHRDRSLRLVYEEPRTGQYVFQRVDRALLESENRGSSDAAPFQNSPVR
jgi:hypothetical protein